MFRNRLVQALFARFREQEDERTLMRFGQLEAVRQTPKQAPVPLFFARKRVLA